MQGPRPRSLRQNVRAVIDAKDDVRHIIMIFIYHFQSFLRAKDRILI